MNKRFWGIIIVICLIFVGTLWLKGRNKADVASGNAQPTHHIEGQSPKNVTLLEYGDYQCPFCGQYYPIVKAVADKYKDQVIFQFRNLPLPNHQNSRSAARAAEAASLQNKF